MVVAADAADAAGDEMGVARVFATHEKAVAAEDGRRAMALGYLAILKDSETPHDPGDRVPVHFHQISFFAGDFFRSVCKRALRCFVLVDIGGRPVDDNRCEEYR